MHTWFSKNLGDPLLAGSELDRIQALFSAELEKSHHPVDMALFIRHESTGDLHCDAIVYFSPAAASVACQLGADECPPPAATDLGLLMGSEDAWAILFAEN